ncbi:MAG: NAD-dependent succinate-semialdehyde dehydrogenase [Ottowia sp.]|uniref:NAD-dependent succinate-semialdehyde dehydrogenase n=1 Tax=Ottowia sp. TaxID=1898956 RepID=UPI003C70F6B2
MTLLTDDDLRETRCLINGEWITGPATFDVLNPATGQRVASVPLLGASHTRSAIDAAHKAGTNWKALTAHERSGILKRWHTLILAHAEPLARLLTEEMGKPLAEARAEVMYGASYVEWFAEACRRVYGEVIPSHDPRKQLSAVRQPVGVVAAITPWNFPNAMLARKLAPALAVGCTVVAKPAEQTPLSALALAKLACAAGVPAGVLNIVTGDPAAIGSELTSNPLVRKLTFTGSTAVGKLLLRQCADTVKRVSMELGGNAPFIVFDDADLDEAVEGAIISKFRNAGQTCVCANRLFVQEGIYDAFSARLVEAVRHLRVGDGMQEGVSIGPLIDDRARRKVERHVQDALAHGAVLLQGAREPDGFFFAPIVLGDVTPSMLVASAETFGPVAPLLRFRDEADVLAQANASEAGLAAYFFTRDIARAHRVAAALEVGMVGINTGAISTEVAPFGGIKESGYGREGGPNGLDDYLDVKYLCLGGLN